MDNLIIINLVLFLWLIVTNVILFKMYQKYHRLTKGIKKKELKILLENINEKLEIQKKDSKLIHSVLEQIQKDGELHVQKVGFVRFNPFNDTGGNQSFCIALLDKNDNGLLISSLHSREQTRLYAKEIRNGKAESRELSKEENLVLKKAKS